MKRVIFLALVVLLSTSAFCQTQVTTNASGNYVSVSKPRASAEGKDTGKTYTDSKGLVYKVYVNSNGKLYIMRKSKKTGKEYKQYLSVK